MRNFFFVFFCFLFFHFIFQIRRELALAIVNSQKHVHELFQYLLGTGLHGLRSSPKANLQVLKLVYCTLSSDPSYVDFVWVFFYIIYIIWRDVSQYFMFVSNRLKNPPVRLYLGTSCSILVTVNPLLHHQAFYVIA